MAGERSPTPTKTAPSPSKSPGSNPESPTPTKTAPSPSKSPDSNPESPASTKTAPSRSKSPNSNPASPKEGSSPGAPVIAGILPADHWVQTAQEEGHDNEDAVSIAESRASSTESLNSHIARYRQIHGRTYHSEIGNAEYWASNDSKANNSMDINHHVLTLMLGGNLFLAPLDMNKVHDVLDIGTGTGTWAIDFADEYPSTQVIGTDISPIQPGWVPTNLKFEIEDCTLDWTFEPESVDFIHMRWLVGSVGDWDALFAQAYRALRPGGWIQSFESMPLFESDDDSVPENSALGQWGKFFIQFGESIQRSFTIVADEIQAKGLREAGFVDIGESNFKTPVSPWPKDPYLKEVGDYAQAVVESDPEGYVMYPATNIGWTPEEVSVYVAYVRKELRSKDTHPFYRSKVVWGRKPVQ